MSASDESVYSPTAEPNNPPLSYRYTPPPALLAGFRSHDKPLRSHVSPAPAVSYGKRQSGTDFIKTAASRRGSVGCTQAIPLEFVFGQVRFHTRWKNR